GNTAESAHEKEQGEARLADLRAARDLVNDAAGYDAVSAEMVLEAFANKLGANGAMKAWKGVLAEKEPSLPSLRINIKGEGADRYANDVVDALVYKAASADP